jgi:hypothetical protein
MDNKFANENGVEWVLKLRSPKADPYSHDKRETYSMSLFDKIIKDTYKSSFIRWDEIEISK